MKIKIRKQLNYPKQELTELLIKEKIEEVKPNLEEKISIISNSSQADKFMRMCLVRFAENTSVMETYINSAYSMTKKQKQFNMYCLLKEVNSNKRK